MTENDVYESNLQHFKISKRYGDKAQCKCPAHDDKQASLTISKGRKCTVFYCHAGCRVDDILTAAGIAKKDTYYDSEPYKTKWRAFVEGREKRKIEAVYNYVSLNGSYAFTKIRLEGKKIIYGMLKNDRFTPGLGHDKPRKAYKAIYGSVQALNKAISEGKPIFIPEGEKDCNTLTKQGYTAFTYGGSNDWQADFAALVKGAEVYILADNDDPGRRVAETILNDVQAFAKSAKIIVPMPDTPKADITDYFEAGHSKEEFEQMLQDTVTENRMDASTNGQIVPQSYDVRDVREMLSYITSYDKDGNIKSKRVSQTVRNFEIVLENDKRFAGKIKFDDFSQQTFLIGDLPWETNNNYRAWSSFDDSSLFSILQNDYCLNSRNDFFDALKNVSHRNRFHPVKDILDSLVWDGKEHIRCLLPDYLGTEDSEYVYQTMRLWMIGAVARIYRPGCKFDYTIILQGKQGIGKSTFLQLLALNDDWFNDSLDSLDSDKSAQSLMGSWIIELAELKSLARTAGGVDSVKRFLTATQDKYRVPYERRADIFLRQCVFAGTTNKSDFLQDETGNRRFLIIQTGVNKPRKNLFEPSVMHEIKSAWAQAVSIWKNEKPNLILPESCVKEAEALQNDSMADDGKIGIIEEYLKGKERVCAIEIWRDALGEQGRPQKWQATEINSIIENIPGWQRMKTPYKFNDYGSQRGFRKLQCSNSDGDNVGEKDDFIPIVVDEQEETPFN